MNEDAILPNLYRNAFINEKQKQNAFVQEIEQMM